MNSFATKNKIPNETAEVTTTATIDLALEICLLTEVARTARTSAQSPIRLSKEISETYIPGFIEYGSGFDVKRNIPNVSNSIGRIITNESETGVVA